jgi:hypothetical protein
MTNQIDVQKQIEATKLLNSTLEQVAQINACDSECQRNIKIGELRNKYEEAKTSKEDSKENLDESRKNYYTYAYGQSYFIDEETKLLDKVSDDHIEKLKLQRDKISMKIANEEEQKHDNEIAVRNMNELLEKYNLSNDKMINSMDDKERVLETSRRKIFYTDTHLGTVEDYEWYASWVIRILLIIAIIQFIYKKKYSFLLIVLVAYLLIVHLL